MEKCKVCDAKTKTAFNIDFKATPICEGCATAIFLQQARWYAETQNQKPSIDDANEKSSSNDWVVIEYIGESYEIMEGVIFEKGTISGLPREAWDKTKGDESMKHWVIFQSPPPTAEKITNLD